MPRFALRLGLLFVALAAFAPPASAQSLTINYNFGGDPFYTAPRQSAITAAGNYILTQFDARGSVTVNFDTFDFGNAGQLAQGGTNYVFSPGTGSVINGNLFRKATTNVDPPFSPPHGTVTWNTNAAFTWYTGSGLPVTSGQLDMQSVALHELSHAMGFASLININVPGRPDGSGAQGATPGSPDTYSRLDSYLRVGTAPNAPLLINPNATFNTSQLGALTGNNIYFHGEMAMAANGGLPVKMAGGGDLSHLDSSVANAVMLPAIGSGVARRTYQNVELAMLIDTGWNQFVWKNNTGNWADNVSTLTSPRWANLDGNDILSPVGTITPNLVLRFGGSGGYNSTNTLNLTATGDRFLVNRMILNATAGTSTIQAGGANVLKFDTTIGITPLIRQDGAGAFNITHPIELTPSNLQLGGDGGGKVSLGGVISGNGGLAKIGTSTFELSGSAANTFTGATTVTGGVLLLNKTPTASAIVGDLNIGSGGIVRLAAADQIQGDGTGGKKITLSGGTLSTGAATGFSDSVGAFELTASSTIALGSGAHSLKFTGITGTPTGTLTITGWSGDQSAPGTAGKILFSDIGTTPNTTFATFLGAVQFDTFGAGGTFLDTGTPGLFELAPVPEPSTILAIAFGALGLGALARRRSLRRSLVSWDL